jgi:hypothetical protein
MAADPTHQDPRALWKALAPETDPVTLDRIHASARKFHRAAALAAVVVPLAVALCAFVIGRLWPAVHDPWLRTAVALLGLGMLASSILVFRARFLPRGPGEPAGVYLRRRLQQELVSSRGGLRYSMLPYAPGILLAAYVALRRGQDPWWAPILAVALMVAAIVLVLWRTGAAAPKLRAQLDELDQMLGR